MHDHNAIVREAMREDLRRGIFVCGGSSNDGSRGDNSPHVLAPTISLCKPLRMHVRDKLLCSVYCDIARLVPL